MSSILNIFVEKKPEFRNEEQKLNRDLALMLGLQAESRIIHFYQVQGLLEDELEKVAYTVFAESSTDTTFKDASSLLHLPHFILELLPGQYDQRAKAAEDCIKLVLGKFDVEVRYKTIYVFPDASAEDLERIQKYLLNPVEMRTGKIETRFEDFPQKNMNVEIIDGFQSLTEEQLISFLKAHALAMTKEDLLLIQKYFIKENRNPTITEIKVLDTYWSDHCRHTTFLTHLKDIELRSDFSPLREAYDQYLQIRKELGREHRPITLMDLGTIGAKYLKAKGYASDIDESEEINACSISRTVRTDAGLKDVLLMFKNETHNHPTEIEPFGGAATCLGGAIRDPLSGRAYVYQGMRITGASDPGKSLKETLPGKLPQRVIVRGAAKGFSSYGNQIGLNTGYVEEIYHPGYEAKRLETGAVIASALKENVRRETPEKGDLIILLGGRTGRDGIGGATGSSKGHDASSISESGAEVQKGNAVEERKLQRFFRNEKASRLIRRCNDFGAGGVSVAIGELAESLDIYLHRVPKKYMGLDPTEIAISESQERMAVVIEEKDLTDFIHYAEEENLEATVVAVVTDTGRLRMYYEDQVVVDVSRAFIDTNGATSEASVLVELEREETRSAKENLTLAKALAEVSELNSCSQKGLLENFDTTIGRNSLILPYGGTHQDTRSPGMVSLIPLKDLTTYDASIMTYGFDPLSLEKNPFTGAYDSVVESLAKVVALGGDPKEVRLSFQEYFRKLGNDPSNWGRPFAALLGGLKAQLDFKVPSIGGKDSMSGSFQNLHVPDTLISFAVTTVRKEHVLSNTLKKKDSVLLSVRTPKTEDVYDALVFEENARLIQKLRERGYILSVDTLKKGLFVTVFNMAIGNRIGFRLEELSLHENRKDPGSFVLEVPREHLGEILSIGHHLLLKVVGYTHDNETVEIDREEISLETLLENHKAPLMEIFNEYKEEGTTLKTQYSPRESAVYPSYVEHPKVLIPVFFGTNCELDIEYAFRDAGAVSDTFVFRNGEKEIKASLEEFAQRIRSSHILMLSGGFSAADEPEGSGKYIANILRNPLIRDAIHDLTDNRKGLVLGICNGFQGLVKSGLLPYGKVIDPHEEMPTLTYNTAGKHMSRMARTKVVSRNTPWMNAAALGDVHDVPVSHGEGRFTASEKLLNELLENGQIITQYTDLSGDVTMEGPFNPNGSMWAIEGISSKDGRVFGKMGHTERYQDGLYQNYSGSYYTEMFRAGVKYFRNTDNL
ncbi:phosphoribosylformylglycinamidine synthase [Proteiniclasticum sp. C24MP]|uniref:phosphoribosylformylglycinamidine synthase n=1 Tax=Proteiniclasticum sp. C24MP TaxID=3374101 RepID=UPI00375463BA